MKKVYEFLDKYWRWIYLGMGVVFALFAVMPLYIVKAANEYIFISGAGVTFNNINFNNKNYEIRIFNYNDFIIGYLISLILISALIILLFKENKISFIKKNKNYFTPIPFLIYLVSIIVCSNKYHDYLTIYANLFRLTFVFYINLLFLILSLLMLILKIVPLKEKSLKPTIARDLETLNNLHLDGAITDGEYAAAKKKLLS